MLVLKIEKVRRRPKLRYLRKRRSDRPRRLSRRRKFGLLAGFAGVILLVIGVQFAYPSGRSLPFATVNGTPVGSKTTEEVVPFIENAFRDIEIEIKSGKISQRSKLDSLGASLDTDLTAEQLTTFPWWQRFMPFSLFWLRPSTSQVYVDFDEGQLGTASDRVAGAMRVEPKNGTVSLDEAGAVAIGEAKDGMSVEPAKLAAKLKTSRYTFSGAKISVEPTVQRPAITNDMIKSVKDKISVVLTKSLVIKNSLDATAAHTPDKSTVVSWIKIGDNLELSLDDEKLAAYVNQIAKSQLIPAGTTTVSVVDGTETGRVDAPAGRGVNLAQIKTDITKALFENAASEVAIQFSDLAPRVVYNRSYSSSQAGLGAYVEDVSRGGNIQVSVRQLSGAGWSASSDAGKSVVAASTYKLYIAAVLFDKINAGQMNWHDSVLSSNTDECLRNMIVHSANNCSEHWISQWGSRNINSSLYTKGISSATTFTNPTAQTSVNDLTTLLAGLERRTMFNQSDADKLIGIMKQQVYRRGIPEGSRGVVADKVGFLWDYLSDAAIVYHPQGTYVLAIMTKGESWGKIAEITRQIETIMYP